MPLQFPALANFFDIVSSFSSWKSIYYIIRVVFIILDIVFFFALIYVLNKAMQFRVPFVPFKKIKFVKNASGEGLAAPESLSVEWGIFEEKVKLASDKDFPMLIIEADKLADEALKRCGFQGETMLERLQQLALTRELKSLEVFWRAHKVRNQIAHEANFSLPRNEAIRHLVSYEKFLKELNII